MFARRSISGVGSGFLKEIADAIGTVFDRFAKSLYRILGVIERLVHLGGLIITEEIASLRIEVGGFFFLALLIELIDLVFQFGKVGFDGDLFFFGRCGLETGDFFPKNVDGVLGVVATGEGEDEGQDGEEEKGVFHERRIFFCKRGRRGLRG